MAGSEIPQTEGTPDISLLERGAEALHLEIANAPRPIELKEAKAIVRVVLEAMREPSGAMLQSIHRGMRFDDGTALRVWREMIDAALTEE